MNKEYDDDGYVPYDPQRPLISFSDSIVVLLTNIKKFEDDNTSTCNCNTTSKRKQGNGEFDSEDPLCKFCSYRYQLYSLVTDDHYDDACEAAALKACPKGIAASVVLTKRDPLMKDWGLRLKTLSKFPILLRPAGLQFENWYCTPRQMGTTSTTCFACGYVYSEWEKADNVILMHKSVHGCQTNSQWSSNICFVIGGSGRPPTKKSRTIVDNYVIEVADSLPSTIVIDNDGFLNTARNGESWQKIPVYPFYPKMSGYNARKQSFAMSNMAENRVLSMVSTGMFYCGRGDSVICFCCGLTMFDWAPTDDPATRHIQFGRECAFVYNGYTPEAIQEIRNSAPPPPSPATHYNPVSLPTTVPFGPNSASRAALFKSLAPKRKMDDDVGSSAERSMMINDDDDDDDGDYTTIKDDDDDDHDYTTIDDDDDDEPIVVVEESDYEVPRRRPATPPQPSLLLPTRSSAVAAANRLRGGPKPQVMEYKAVSNGTRRTARPRASPVASVDRMGRAPRMCFDVCLKTFDDFFYEGPIPARVLALGGFAFRGVSDIVNCLACNLTVSGWKSHDDPAAIHHGSSPHCARMKDRFSTAQLMTLMQVYNRRRDNLHDWVDDFSTTTADPSVNWTREMRPHVTFDDGTTNSHYTQTADESRLEMAEWLKRDEWARATASPPPPPPPAARPSSSATLGSLLQAQQQEQTRPEFRDIVSEQRIILNDLKKRVRERMNNDGGGGANRRPTVDEINEDWSEEEMVREAMEMRDYGQWDDITSQEAHQSRLAETQVDLESTLRLLRDENRTQSPTHSNHSSLDSDYERGQDSDDSDVNDRGVPPAVLAEDEQAELDEDDTVMKKTGILSNVDFMGRYPVFAESGYNMEEITNARVKAKDPNDKDVVYRIISKANDVPKRLLATENTEVEERVKCKYCYDDIVSVLFLPCRHLCCCISCSLRMKDCPVCRKSIQNRFGGIYL